MQSSEDRHIASLQHLLDEIEEVERQYRNHHDSFQPQLWMDQSTERYPADRASRSLARQYQQVYREHEVTIEACRHTARQLRDGLFSDREVVFLIERFRSVLNRVRRDHDWLNRLTLDASCISARESSV